MSRKIKQFLLNAKKKSSFFLRMSSFFGDFYLASLDINLSGSWHWHFLSHFNLEFWHHLENLITCKYFRIRPTRIEAKWEQQLQRFDILEFEILMKYLHDTSPGIALKLWNFLIFKWRNKKVIVIFWSVKAGEKYLFFL